VATKKSDTTTPDMETTTVTDNRTEPQDFDPTNGGHNVVAAWQGLVHLFDAQVERFDVTNDGVFVVGLTFDSTRIPDTATLIHDISYRGDKFVTRDLPLVPTYDWVRGVAPAKFEDAGEMTAWMAKFFRGAGDGDNNRSPQYVKDAISAYKTAAGIASRRGRPPKKIDIETLGSIDEAILSQVPESELLKLQATLDRIRAAQAGAAVSA
jgi:hypothetical protein